MQIVVNERTYDTAAGSTVDTVRARCKADADVLIVNGYPADPDQVLADGDRLVLIRRGEVLPAAELEALLAARHSPGVHDRVRSATVGIAGAGGLGSAVTIALARTGVGRLIIADFDLVEPSNLNRQHYFLDQLGLPKVYALRDTLARINPYVHVAACHLRLTPGNIAEIFGSVDILVEAFDRADQKAMLAETFTARFPDKPLVAGSGMAGAGPANNIKTRRAFGNLYLCGDGSTAAASGVGLMAPRVGIVAHHQANAVLRLLLGDDPATDDANP
jgi:sulfur carrier protein ThiS adenylyltransferase